MRHLDPDTNGPRVGTAMLMNLVSKQNDVQQQREGFIQARDNMPNNTFLKLFNSLCEDNKDDSKQEEL